MFGSWTDFERTFAAMEEFRRRVEQSLAEPEGTWEPSMAGSQFSLWDQGEALVLKADLPGVSDKDIQLQLTQDVLTLSATRKTQGPEGYSVHRQERAPLRISRAFTLPVKVDGDNITASVKDGVLTVTMPKAPESQPRQITVKTAS